MLSIYLYIHQIQDDIDLFYSATKTTWISVEYRLAPEYKFPIWLDDACEVTRQILANKIAYGTSNSFIYDRWMIFCVGGDENTKVGVAGDSAGGMIAASIGQTIPNLDFQVEISMSQRILIVLSFADSRLSST